MNQYSVITFINLKIKKIFFHKKANIKVKTKTNDEKMVILACLVHVEIGNKLSFFNLKKKLKIKY